MTGRREMSSMSCGVSNQQPSLRRPALAVTILACFGLRMSVLSAGQATTSLRGTITDPTGSTVAGAKVLLAHSESKPERTATTGGQGREPFLLFPPRTAPPH